MDLVSAALLATGILLFGGLSVVWAFVLATASVAGLLGALGSLLDEVVERVRRAAAPRPAAI